MIHQVFNLPITKVSKWIFNCYIVEGSSDSVVIIDPGLPSIGGLALRHLLSTGRGVGNVAAVTCSHGHPDHLAGMPALADAGCKQFVLPQACEGYLAGIQPRNFEPAEILKFMPILADQPFSAAALIELARVADSIGFRKDGFKFPIASPTFASSSSPLAQLDGWEVLDTPGHTDESICWYHAESETLISGDAVVTYDGRAWFNPEWLDGDLCAHTEEMLRSLPVRHLLPGHGLPIAGDVWSGARSSTDQPEGKRLLARCARRLGSWSKPS